MCQFQPGRSIRSWAEPDGWKLLQTLGLGLGRRSEGLESDSRSETTFPPPTHCRVTALSEWVSESHYGKSKPRAFTQSEWVSECHKALIWIEELIYSSIYLCLWNLTFSKFSECWGGMWVTFPNSTSFSLPSLIPLSPSVRPSKDKRNPCGGHLRSHCILSPFVQPLLSSHGHSGGDISCSSRKNQNIRGI